eukprot:14285782-Heterocapsa_arctica.AAC.1
MGTTKGSEAQVPDPEGPQDPAAGPAGHQGQQAGQAEGENRRPRPYREPWDTYPEGSQGPQQI